MLYFQIRGKIDMVLNHTKNTISNLKILVLEDDALMTKLYRDILESMGFGKVTAIRNAEDALALVKQINFDLIICDWKLNGTSGIDFVKHIRALHDYEKCNVPIVMISGKASLEDVAIARDAGITEYIVKPFTIKAICAKLRSIIEAPRKFVIAPEFIGPDRRRKAAPALNIENYERRLYANESYYCN